MSILTPKCFDRYEHFFTESRKHHQRKSIFMIFIIFEVTSNVHFLLPVATRIQKTTALPLVIAKLALQPRFDLTNMGPFFILNREITTSARRYS